MSWDYYLGDSKKTTLIKEEDLKTKLSDEFVVTEVVKDENGWVRGFFVKEKNKDEDWEFARQEDGSFWTSSTMSEEWSKEIWEIANKIASKLNWQIKDPQSDAEWHDQVPFQNETVEFAVKVLNKITGKP